MNKETRTLMIRDLIQNENKDLLGRLEMRIGRSQHGATALLTITKLLSERYRAGWTNPRRQLRIT